MSVPPVQESKDNTGVVNEAKLNEGLNNQASVGPVEPIPLTDSYPDPQTHAFPLIRTFDQLAGGHVVNGWKYVPIEIVALVSFNKYEAPDAIRV